MIEVTLPAYILSFVVLALSMCAAFYGVCWGLHWRRMAWLVTEEAEAHGERASSILVEFIDTAAEALERLDDAVEYYDDLTPLRNLVNENMKDRMCCCEINGQVHACRTSNPMPGDLVGVGLTQTEACRDLLRQEEEAG